MANGVFKNPGTPGHDGWDEQRYLAENPDVATAIANGQFPSGYVHYLQHGRHEGRADYYTEKLAKETGSRPTRLCLDPWRHLEFKADGTLIPCCMHALPQIGDLRAGTHLDARNNDAIRGLRRQLLDGDIGAVCVRCHIRPWGTVDQQAALVRQYVGEEADPLGPGRLASARIDITERCNLRCVYCPVSQPGYHPVAMENDDLDKISAFLSSAGTLDTIEVNGHGETTYHDAWRPFCDALLDKGQPLSMITNFARPMDTEELQTLARFQTIQISIDTADAELLKRIRRKVSLGNIVANIVNVRKHAIAAGRESPQITFSCGVYDKNVFGLVDFACFCAACKIDAVTFWSMKKYPDVTGADIAVNPVESLDPRRLADAIDQFEAAQAILAEHGIATTVAGEFIRDLKSRVPAR